MGKNLWMDVPSNDMNFMDELHRFCFSLGC